MTSNRRNTKKAKQTANYYNNQSQKYDRIYNSYLGHTHQYLLDQLDLQAGESVLDCSAGTGILAGEMLHRFDIKKLILNDPANKMLNIARDRLKFAKTEIAYTNYFAEELDQLLPKKFDHIICLNSFHYYVDQERVLYNVHQLLKSGGTLWLLDWNRTGFFILSNKLIDWFSSMNINTRSLAEIKSLLKFSDFSIEDENNWRFRLWNFFYLKATKTK